MHLKRYDVALTARLGVGLSLWFSPGFSLHLSLGGFGTPAGALQLTAGLL